MITFLCRTPRVAVAGIVLSAVTLLDAVAAVPDPAQVFTPKASVSLYLDVATMKEMPSWKALKDKAAGAAQSGMSQLPGGGQYRWDEWSSLRGHDLAELAVVVEGDNWSADKPDPNGAVVVVARFSGTIDPAALGADVFAALEKGKPGLSNRVASTSSKIGAADAIQIPGDALGDTRLGFDVTAAVGPAADGTILVVGRKERVKDFLEGRGPNRPPGGVETLLAQRGQFWLFVGDLGKTISAAASSSQPANPSMMTQIASQTEKLRELGFSAAFEASNIAVQLLIGFTDDAQAQKSLGEVQGMLGMVGMMASQSGKPAPAFLGRIKPELQGKRLVLSTTVGLEDLDLGSAGGAGAAGAPRGGTGKAVVKVDPLTAPEKSPVEIELVRLLPPDTLDLRRGQLRVTNSATQGIKEVRITCEYLDEANRRLGEWTRQQRDPAGGLLVPASTTRNVEWNLFKAPVRTEKVRFVVREVLFADDTVWKAAEGADQ